MNKDQITKRIVELKLGVQTQDVKLEIQKLQQQLDGDVVTQE
ncbi:hypothetical protein PQZ39_00420 [bacterium]|nr:hypothetical protein [bacterium]